MIGGISLQRIDSIFRRMGLREIVAFPFYEDGVMVGLITGYIERDNSEAFLEHIIVLPEATNPLRVMHQMPAEIHALLAQRGVRRTTLYIDRQDKRKRALDKWARRCGYTPFGASETRDWYELVLEEN